MKNFFARYNLWNFFLSVLLLVIFNLALAYGICRYQNWTGLDSLINVLFTLGVVNAMLGAFIYYGSYGANRNVNYQMAQSVGIGSNSDRREEEFRREKANANFFFKMAFTGVLVFLISLGLTMYL